MLKQVRAMTHIVIIGGGIAGLSAAAHLAQIADVTLVEAEPHLGYHASGRSAAAFIGDYGNAPTCALNAASLDHLRDIPELMKRRVMMMVGRAGEETELIKEASGLGMWRVGLEEAQSHFPILNPNVLSSAALRDDAYDIDTGLLMDHFRTRAKAGTATIITKAPVTALAQHGSGWQVSAGAQVYTCDLVVNAAGAWADHIAALAGVPSIGLQPFRRSMARIALPSQLDCSDWALIDGVGERFYAKPDAGALLVSPADEDPVQAQDAWAEDEVLARGLAAYEEMVTEPVTRMLSNWAGLRSFVSDRTLVIGPEPDCPSFFWLAGQGGYGFQTSFGAARLLRDRVTGTTPELSSDAVAALSPDRFR